VQHSEQKPNGRKSVAVVAAIIESNGKILCVQRGEHRLPYISRKWEFPGGKIELTETPEAAVIREIREELHLSISVDSHLVTVDHDYADFHISMAAYLCHAAIVDPIVVLTEHIDHRWLAPRDPAFLDLDWAEADVPIVEVLRSKT
jgi:8-oxo-dGTP diphosphatase